MWGMEIYEKTLKHIFQKHFHYLQNDTWNVNPHDKVKVKKRVIPTLRMVMSWKDKKVLKFTERKIVEDFLAIIKYDYPDLYESKCLSVCEFCRN